MLFAIYISSVAVALVSFVLYYTRLNEVLLEQGMKCTPNSDTVMCLVSCILPVLNLYYGHEYYKLGIVLNDAEFKECINIED
jgi:hypothetical protein